MVVLNWSWLRRLCSTRRPSGTETTDIGLTLNRPLSALVGKVRESRGGCGSTKPPGWSTFSSYAAQPGTTCEIALRMWV